MSSMHHCDCALMNLLKYNDLWLVLWYDIYFQAVITQINLAIGASGFVSQECKVVVTQYGKTILDLLVAEVYISVSYFFQYFVSCLCHHFSILEWNFWIKDDAIIPSPPSEH